MDLGQITEMIHVASLIHDDVLDEAETRRGGMAVHTMYTNKVAVLAGDYLLAKASVLLARLQHFQVVSDMTCFHTPLNIPSHRFSQSCINSHPHPLTSSLSPPPTIYPLTPLAPSLFHPPSPSPPLSFIHLQVEVMASALDALVQGEIMQARPKKDDLLDLNYYLRKSYFKTASLISSSCRSSALLGR